MQVLIRRRVETEEMVDVCDKCGCGIEFGRLIDVPLLDAKMHERCRRLVRDDIRKLFGLLPYPEDSSA
jgi:hypothetical protein